VKNWSTSNVLFLFSVSWDVRSDATTKKEFREVDPPWKKLNFESKETACTVVSKWHKEDQVKRRLEFENLGVKIQECTGNTKRQTLKLV